MEERREGTGAFFRGIEIGNWGRRLGGYRIFEGGLNLGGDVFWGNVVWGVVLRLEKNR